MASHDPNSVPEHNAQIVGNAFVEQYYQVLHQSPAHVFKFYQDLSFLSRPDSKGYMTTVTTMQAINDMILSQNYEECTAEIETADAQDSYNGGVLVLVTGYLTEKGGLRRKFTQTFFLAPQEPGYFVLNDFFRYVEDKKPHDPLPVSEKSVNDNPPPAFAESYTDPQAIPNHSMVEPNIEEVPTHVPEIPEPAIGLIAPPSVEKEIIYPPIEARPNEAQLVVDSEPPLPGDAPKISYASIVKVLKVPNRAAPVYVPTNVTKAPAPTAYRQPANSAKHAPPEAASIPGSESALKNSNNTHEEGALWRAIPFMCGTYRSRQQSNNYKMNSKGSEQDGIQVRSHKGFCFGFVEFEQQSSVQSALAASPILIGECKAVVEEKRTTTRVGSNGRGGRPNSSVRGGYRSESFRGSGNFGLGRGYGRNEFRNQGEFSGRSRGQGGRSGGRDGYHRVNQSETGRQGGPNQTPHN